MLRITDARTGQTVDATPARRGLTRVEAHPPADGPSALRVLLVADLLVRALELDGTPVWAMLSGAHDQAELLAAATALGVRPFENAHGLASGVGEARTVHVLECDGPPPPGGGVALVVAPAATADDVPGRVFPDALDPRVDPAALRLALLSVPRQTSVRLAADALDASARTLARWRHAVAQWSRQPSRPVPEEVRGRLRAAWEADLDVPGVLTVLHDVETASDLPDGARFETYAYTDRLLGLELTRDIGTLG